MIHFCELLANMIFTCTICIMYKEILQKQKLSVTKSRLSILESLDGSGPITIDTLKKNIGNNIDVSTLYRSLKVMVDTGIIYQTDFREGVSYFEFQGDHHHHHIVCTECKQREIIDLCFGNQAADVARSKGYTITNHIFELFGLCKKCSTL